MSTTRAGAGAAGDSGDDTGATGSGGGLAYPSDSHRQPAAAPPAPVASSTRSQSSRDRAREQRAAQHEALAGPPSFESEPHRTLLSVKSSEDVMHGLQIGTQVISALALITMLWWLLSPDYLGGLSSHGLRYFNWHPFLNSLGFFLFFQSAMMYRMWPMEMQNQARVHMVLNTLGLASIIAAIIIVYRYHDMINVAHFYSVHSWIGMLTLTLLALQWLIGMTLFGPVLGLCANMRHAPRWQSWYNSVSPIHRWLGIAAFTTLVANVLLGLHNKQSLIPASDPYAAIRRLANVIALLVALSGASVLYWLTNMGRSNKERGASGASRPGYNYQSIVDHDEAT